MKNFKGVDPSKVLSCQEMPVQSAIVEPNGASETISMDDDDIDISFLLDKSQNLVLRAS